jgi:hypothetical protein
VFVDSWFAPRQRADLRRLAAALARRRGAAGDALRLGLSRIIVTKLAGAGASLARDVSHSRPRRALEDSPYDVFRGYERSVARLADRLEASPPRGGVTVRAGDARRLSGVPDNAVDMVVTSPPYLNAIDYLRGHRLALVWLGHRVGELRAVRADSIGAERAPAGRDHAAAEALALTSGLDGIERLPSRIKGMLSRYALDLAALLREAARVLKPGGRATFVMGDSTLRGVFIENSALLKAAARRAGLRFVSQARRPLEGKRRYLPPPGRSARTGLDKRMSLETIVTVVRE